ncbi:MAG: glycosyltransferase [Planctomycetes bacterium]|nr:glycosyltransferase [Planctomycetota bacterium]
MAEEGSAAGKPRLLFCSWHGYLDDASGAAVSLRELFALLAGRGWPCAVLCGPALDAAASSGPQPRERPGLRVVNRPAPGGPVSFTLSHFHLDGVGGTMFLPSAFQQGRGANQPEGEVFLALLSRILERWRPDLVFTYGGDDLARAIRIAARERGLPVVFWLRNPEYFKPATFATADAILVPSAFLRDLYQARLGLSCTAIPSPVNRARVLCPDRQGRFVTFVNPEPAKGLFLFARLAEELGRRRPDIPLLVVESRGRAEALAGTGLDLGRLGNLFGMPNTPDPRDFFRVTRLLLAPSLWAEPSGRVVMEALVNGIPVLASNRGGLPETLARAGYVFPVPERYTSCSTLVPAAEEVLPWIETILRLWDDRAFYEQESRRCVEAARDWEPERLGPRYEGFLMDTLSRFAGRSRSGTGTIRSIPGLEAEVLDALLAEGFETPLPVLPSPLYSGERGRSEPPHPKPLASAAGAARSASEGSETISSLALRAALEAGARGEKKGEGIDTPCSPGSGIDSGGPPMAGKREDWFPTSVWYFDVPGHEALNARLLALIQAERRRDAVGMTNRSVVLGWHSAEDLHRREEFQEFVGLIDRHVGEVAAFGRWDLRRREAVILGCWANINGRYASNVAHYHPHAVLSGVYYVQAPEGGGDLFFCDPRPGAVLLAPDVTEHTPWTFQKVTYRPVAGRMLLFPGWLEHGVEPNLSEQERVCLSFNIGLRTKG